MNNIYTASPLYVFSGIVALPPPIAENAGRIITNGNYHVGDLFLQEIFPLSRILINEQFNRSFKRVLIFDGGI